MGKRKVTSTHYLFDPVYHFHWMIVFGGPLQNAIDKYAKRIEEDSWTVQGNPKAHFAAYRNKRNGVIWFESKPKSLAFVAHECFHATMYVFERLDMKGPTEETEEVFAYYLEWLVDNIQSL
jgi:hypothetical protein